MPRSLIPVMAPHGSLRLDQANDDFVLESGLADRLEKSFERGSAHGLLHLGTSEAGSVLPASLAWWRDFGMRFIADSARLAMRRAAGRTELAAPTSSELAALIDDAPPMRGGEYLRPDVLARHWGEIRQALEAGLAESGLSLNEFLKARDPGWRLVGRVHFNLAENRPDPEFHSPSWRPIRPAWRRAALCGICRWARSLREFAGLGRASALALAKAGAKCSSTMEAARRKRKPSSQRFAKAAAARTRSASTSRRPTGRIAQTPTIGQAMPSEGPSGGA